MKREISQICSIVVCSLFLVHCGGDQNTTTTGSTSGESSVSSSGAGGMSGSSSSGMAGAGGMSGSSSSGMAGAGGMSGSSSSGMAGAGGMGGSSSSGMAGAGGMGGAGGAGGGGPQVVINEIESSGGMPGDWVELYNAGAAMADISSWVFKDNDDTHIYMLPNGTMLAPGQYIVLEEATFAFGLGASDSARLYDATGTVLVDSYTWTAHADTTYGRCPNGTGAFQTTITATKGAANDCGM